MRFHIRALVMTAAVLLVAACGSGQLSRSQAERQLEAQFKARGLTSTIELADSPRKLKKFGCVYDGCPEKPFENFSGLGNGWNDLVRLSKQGLATFQLVERTRPQTWNGYALFRVTLTDAGKRFLIKETTSGNTVKAEVVVREFKNLEVLGIGAPAELMGHKVAVVNYRLEYDITPVGQVLLVREGPNALARERQGQALFVLYDDGWKLDSL